MPSEQQPEAVEQLIDQFLAAHPDGRGDVDSFCQRYGQHLPHLRQALQHAARVRQARLRRAEASSESGDSSDVASGGADLTGQRLGKYTLRSRIGGGGFGDVYEATSDDSSQVVAIKVLRPEYTLHSEVQHRFKREAEMLRALGHPGIVPVYEAGQARDRPYFVMKRINGSNLREFTRAQPIEPIKAAQLIAEAATICHHAHGQQIVHRDIKPENILVDEHGRLFVADFGLAKQLDAETRLTHSDQRLGTPHYMPPEQADPRLGPISVSSDVYSLGATLYFLLTGHPPFPIEAGIGREATIHQIKWDRPRKPREWNGEIPIELETLCLQCLEKLPEDRCANASELAAELRNFIGGRHVAARLPGRLGRVQRWCIRHPIASGTTAAASVMLLVGSGAALHFAGKAASSEAEAGEQAQRAMIAATRETVATEGRRRREYVADVRDAQAALKRGETPVALRLLAKYENLAGQDDPRAFEWHYLNRLARTPSPVTISREGIAWNRVVLSPNGEQAACTDQEGKLTVVSVPDGGEVYHDETPLADYWFLPDGRRMLAFSNARGDIGIVYDIAARSIEQEFKLGYVTTCLAVSPSGDAFFTGGPGNDMHLWSLGTLKPIDLCRGYKRGQFERSPTVQNGAVVSAAFSDDGGRLAVGYDSGTTQVWDPSRERMVASGPEHTGPVTGIAFSHDGSRVASQSFGAFNNRVMSYQPGQVHVWQVSDGTGICTLMPHQQKAGPAPVLESSSFIHFGLLRPVFLPGDREIITTGPLAAQKWSAQTGVLRGMFTGDGSVVHSVSLNRGGRFLATASASGAARVWPVDAAGDSVFLSTEYGIRTICANKSRLAVLYEDGVNWSVGQSGHNVSRSDNRAILFKPFDGGAEANIAELDEGLDTLCMANGRFVHGTKLLEASDEAQAAAWRSRCTTIGRHEVLAVCSDESIVHGKRDGTIELLRKDNTPAWTIKAHDREVTAVTVSGDGALIASGSLDGQVRIWSHAKGEILATLDGHRREVSGLAFSPDGARLATSSGRLRNEGVQPGDVRVWDTASWQLCAEFSAGPKEMYTGVAWSPDSSRLFAAANPITVTEATVEPGRVVVWDGTPGARSAPLERPSESAPKPTDSSAAP